MATSKNQEREAREARDRLKRYNARQAVHTHQVKRRRRDNLIAIGGIVVVAALATATQLFYFNGGPGTPTPAPTSSDTATGNVGNVPSPAVAQARTWLGQISLNDIPLDFTLDGAKAPQAVASFVTDAQSGYFQGANTCHRILIGGTTGSLIQCGSSDGNGTSSKDYSFGPIENAPADGVYPAGTIAMARTGDNAFGNGHQFFIVTGEITLPGDSAGGYTVIGQVTKGLDALTNKIISKGVDGGGTDGRPAVTTVITNISVE